MMSLHAEAPVGDEGGSSEEPNSELAFQTHVMKVRNMVLTGPVAFVHPRPVIYSSCATGIT